MGALTLQHALTWTAPPLPKCLQSCISWWQSARLMIFRSLHSAIYIIKEAIDTMQWPFPSLVQDLTERPKSPYLAHQAFCSASDEAHYQRTIRPSCGACKDGKRTEKQVCDVSVNLAEFCSEPTLYLSSPEQPGGKTRGWEGNGNGRCRNFAISSPEQAGGDTGACVAGGAINFVLKNRRHQG